MNKNKKLITDFKITLRPYEKDDTDGLILDEVHKLREQSYNTVKNYKNIYKENQEKKKYANSNSHLTNKGTNNDRAYFKNLRISSNSLH